MKPTYNASWDKISRTRYKLFTEQLNTSLTPASVVRYHRDTAGLSQFVQGGVRTGSDERLAGGGEGGAVVVI